MAISGLVITYNEEKYIKECVKSLFKVCEEVIVVDSFSIDGTVEIAKKEGAKVILKKFLGDGPQRQFGLEFCNNDWVLNLDADEFLDKDAESFIKSNKYEIDNFDAYSFRVKNFLGLELINYSGWYPDSKVRFFNKNTAKPSTSMVHQKVIASNEKKLNVHILHYGWESLEQMISKKNQYSTWHANQLFNESRKVYFYKPILNGSVAFFRCYFFKKGVFNGVNGLTMALIQGFFSYMKYAKLLRIQREEN